jgi:hypothetical protein
MQKLTKISKPIQLKFQIFNYVDLNQVWRVLILAKKLVHLSLAINLINF